MFWWYLLVGVFSGVLGGMGLGGGTVLIPILTIFLSVKQHVAQAVNLVSFVPVGIIALIIHIKNKLVKGKGLLFVILPAILFSVLASLLSVKLNGDLLRKFFGGFLLILSIIEFFSREIYDRINKNKK